MLPYRIALVACPLLMLPALVGAQRLSAPTHALMDESLDVRVRGLPSGGRATLRASMRDSAGRSWTAAADFVADARGEIVPARHAARTGAYVGVDPMGLVTMMDAADAPGTLRYVPPTLGDVPLGIVLVVNDRVVDSATVVRRFAPPGVRALDVREPGGLVGTLFLPVTPARAPAILAIGGSEGGNSATDVAAQLAAHGFATLSVAYFGVEGLPSAIDGIPLEYFDRAIAFLRAQPSVDSSRVGLFGTSKGAEAALLVAAQNPGVRAVVAYAASSVAWSCICTSAERSSWTRAGNPVPSVPPGRDPAHPAVQGQPQRPSVHYRYRLRDTAAVAKAATPVERIRGPVLLVAGDSDQLWPSGEMMEQLRARLAFADRPPGDILLVYPGAGHLIGKSYLPAGSTRIAAGRLETGGSPRANAAAQADAWPRALRFLSQALRAQ